MDKLSQIINILEPLQPQSYSENAKTIESILGDLVVLCDIRNACADILQYEPDDYSDDEIVIVYHVMVYIRILEKSRAPKKYITELSQISQPTYTNAPLLTSSKSYTLVQPTFTTSTRMDIRTSDFRDTNVKIICQDKTVAKNNFTYIRRNGTNRDLIAFAPEPGYTNFVSHIENSSNVELRIDRLVNQTHFAITRDYRTITDYGIFKYVERMLKHDTLFKSHEISYVADLFIERMKKNERYDCALCHCYLKRALIQASKPL